MNPHGIMFHHFHGEAYPASQGSICAQTLAELIEYTGRDRILSAAEWMRRCEEDALQPEDVCITFDDALQCQRDVALPVLEQLGITAFWFIHTCIFEGEPSRLEIFRAFRETRFDSINQFYAAFEDRVRDSVGCQTVSDALDQLDIGSYLCEYPFYTPADRRFRFLRNEILGEERYAQVMDEMIVAFGDSPEALARGLWIDAEDVQKLHETGHVIGLHSHTHPVALAALPPDRQRWEYETNLQKLEAITGTRPIAMAHPCNSYAPETLDILRTLEIKIGFRANMNQDSKSPLEIPRADHSNIVTEMQTCGSPSSPETKLATSR
ncbi:MAG: polysaccharide deacetylase family protein [Planctomycetes bacterium]|nr:polysaccharide deacetylase family protein [Planctomycetota bacterium]